MKRNRLIAVLFILAIGCTCAGIFKLWGAFRAFDESILREAARQLILYGGITVAGIIMMIVLMLLMHLDNAANMQELEALRKKNETMAEINQQMQALAHHQRLETIGTMTAGIAHDFNNLLTPIMGYSIMTMEMLPADAVDIQENLMEVYNASVKAKDIISRLSELSRKNTEMRFETINPDDLVNKVLHVTSPALPKKVDIFRNLNCSRKYIERNETQLSQLILNLIINAFHALGEEGGEVTVTTEKVGSDIMIEVADNGPGIPDDIKEKIFDPFFTTKEAGVGTGLGLAIALQAAEDHKGRIEVESEEGKGASFKVFIPELVIKPDRRMQYYEHED